MSQLASDFIKQRKINLTFIFSKVSFLNYYNFHHQCEQTER